MSYRNLLILLAGLAFLLTVGCTSEGALGDTTPKLAAECTVDPDEDDWLCHEDLEVYCEEGGVDSMLIFLEPSSEYLDPADKLPEECAEIELSINREGPFDVGTHDIVVTADALDEDENPVRVICESTLTVKDEDPPEANEEPVELWPPNHKFHTISADDCVKDACDEELDVTFFYASSDEPVNDKGDGNTEPDIIFECDRVQVRAERQGGGNGRVYKLLWIAIDDSGNSTEGECVVNVPHDQSGDEAVADEPAHEVWLDCDDGEDE